MVEHEKLEDKGGDYMDVTTRPHSYRHYSPAEFHRLIDETDNRKEEDKIKEELGVIEAGRFEDLLSTLHDLFWRLDEDEAETFANRNPGIMEWVNVYARLNHSQKFDLEGLGVK